MRFDFTISGSYEVADVEIDDAYEGCEDRTPEGFARFDEQSSAEEVLSWAENVSVTITPVA